MGSSLLGIYFWDLEQSLPTIINTRLCMNARKRKRERSEEEEGGREG